MGQRIKLHQEKKRTGLSISIEETLANDFKFLVAQENSDVSKEIRKYIIKYVKKYKDKLNDEK